ncbi:stage III sporulation protein AD [Dorea acetigenes]|uniref:Stage III sporulation protein AD n=1 Tax=Dorea acetigenes TaxID=2981787 RepID=A0ABT2RQ10_9FIRM|nr:SpoIIIAC/SpoIIIAD family protein [Dorea acetigenes]MCB6413643.1 stage III sporulation protein AD [Faecalimonas umbilicata]MCU6687492.1 stage III sporulation protein AD [Dorea acetigenes]
MSVMQIGLLGIAGVLMAVQFKSGKSEYGIYISIGLSLLVFFSIVSKLKVILDVVRQIGETIHLNTAYVGMLMKMLGIAYVAEFSSGICKDAGYQTIASQIEIFSKLAILVMGMPVILALLEMIGEFLS